MKPLSSEPTNQMRPFEQSLPMGLLRARESAMKVFRPMLADHNLSEQQWRVLRALSARAEQLDAGELAEKTFLLAPSLSRILASLEKRELIERADDPADQRRSLISLSGNGADLVSRIGPTSEALYRSIEEAFGRDRLKRLLAELSDLAAMELHAVRS